MLFHSLKKRIEGSRTNLISVTVQLVDHPLAVNGAFVSMVQNVDFPKSQKDFPSYRMPPSCHIPVIVDGHRNNVNKYFSCRHCLPAGAQIQLPGEEKPGAVQVWGQIGYGVLTGSSALGSRPRMRVHDDTQRRLQNRGCSGSTIFRRLIAHWGTTWQIGFSQAHQLQEVARDRHQLRRLVTRTHTEGFTLDSAYSAFASNRRCFSNWAFQVATGPRTVPNASPVS